MGGGYYCSNTRSLRSDTLGYATKSASEIFTSRSMHPSMNPSVVDIRESCDSDEHPNSLAILLALDVTGSMGNIPHQLVKEGLPRIMEGIIQKGVADPQLLFLGIGDHVYDEAPLQVGQFESSDELLDKWLTNLYLEGHGGGNKGESYLLAWYFASKHTAIDCFKKRSQKGFLFTVGDEHCLPELPARSIKEIMGCSQASSVTSLQLLEDASETYNVYHLHVMEGHNGRDKEVMDGWKQLIGENLILVKNHCDIPRIIADIVTQNADKVVVQSSEEKPTGSKKTKVSTPALVKPTEEML